VPKRYGQACPVARSLEFLGERWTLLIVRDLLGGPKRFQDLQTSLAGVAPTVLSERLKVLEDNRIVRRVFYSDHPPRAEYILTEQGVELRATVRALAIWGSRHLHGEWNLVHDACEREIEMAYYCPACGKTIGANEVSRRPTSARARKRVRSSPARSRRSTSARGVSG
jgi:DNA-binding HxlR family transcriptional regulator